ncbi:FHA domain-containing protein [Mitsuaria sp. GD03876]|uniref:FHA domain-containing protein n=1 Tax=Mitsuaria sp. GD03876 TaxID=2975399 RepID=UPI00244CEC61|nr:FHA domain-containing protein [Mitsuaria sp. GD03876]MDH0865333.1 hypothetical protein [Mitsuaria sp. GD03876]
MTDTLLPVDTGTLELRVLSGLQAGAALPLEDALTVGAGDEADLLLLDEGIAPVQLRVLRMPDGTLRLEALDDGVGLASGEVLAPGEPVPLAVGEAFRAGTVWLANRPSEDAWDPWTPPATATMPAADAVLVEAPALSSSADDEPGAGMRDDGAPAQPPRAEAPAIVGDVRAGGARRLRSRTTKRPMRALGSVIVASGLLSTMLGVAALVRQASEDEPGAASAGADVARSEPVSSAASATSAASTASAASASPDQAADTAVAARTASRTASATPASDGTAPIAMADRRSEGGRLLVRIPGEGTVTLPFDVRSVLLGAQSHVILTDGRRLDPGDEIGDWRLVDVQPGVLVFDGPRKVRIGW